MKEEKERLEGRIMSLNKELKALRGTIQAYYECSTRMEEVEKENVTLKRNFLTKMLNFVTRKQKFVTRKQKFVTRKQKFVTRKQKFVTRKQKFVTRKQKFVTRKQKFVRKKKKLKPLKLNYPYSTSALVQQKSKG